MSAFPVYCLSIFPPVPPCTLLHFTSSKGCCSAYQNQWRLFSGIWLASNPIWYGLYCHLLLWHAVNGAWWSVFAFSKIFLKSVLVWTQFLGRKTLLLEIPVYMCTFAVSYIMAVWLPSGSYLPFLPAYVERWKQGEHTSYSYSSHSTVSCYSKQR